MPAFLISPAEHGLTKTLGSYSEIPEKYGADVLWVDPSLGIISCQRKTWTDLIASAVDGRLAREIPQLRNCAIAFLIVEGQPHFTADGQMIHGWAKWTRAQWWSALRSLQYQGLIVEHTANEAETVALIEAQAKWLAKGEHLSFVRRPGPMADKWDFSISNRAWGIHFLQGLPGFGPKLAATVFDAFGRVPLALTVTREELMGIKGLGKARVDVLCSILGGSENDS